MEDAELAAQVADTAGRIALAIRDSDLWTGKALGDVGDQTVNAVIIGALSAHRPDDGILSEETPDGVARLGRERVWIVDPIDGTREYAEGRNDWAVHVALCIGGRPEAGAVALPARGQLFRSDRPAPLPERPRRLRLLVSRTRPPVEAERVADALGAELVPMGSAGAKAMAVIAGLGDIYLHVGGQHEWDNCAPVAVALAAGLHAARLDGAPIVYNQCQPLVPDLLICRAELAEPVRAALGRI
jgi:3'(2'), 5'-bisphosphate nucleotidase